MSSSLNRSGRCVCGAVSFNAVIESEQVGACHCNTCRKWGGGPFMEVNCGTSVQFNDQAPISVYDSSDWAERGFCSTCGSHLFYRLKDNQHHMVPVGLLDDDSGLSFKQQVFVDEKPAYYDFANSTEKLTGAELFAKFTAES